MLYIKLLKNVNSKKLYTKEEIMKIQKSAPIRIDIEKLSKFMQKQHLSKTKLIKTAKISSTTLSNIFKNKQTTRYTTLYKIVTALNINIQDIVVKNKSKY
jgi:DNA-binding Xre family transcriptional regulator